jgi:LmbE family N-acetylglucosaminyl deacetylase
MSYRKITNCLSITALFFAALLAVVPAKGQTAKPRKSIMIFAAHADDVEGLAGGTLAKYIHDGYEGVYVGVINNTAGCLIESPPNRSSIFTVSKSPNTYSVDGLETIQIRNEEARSAAAVFGAIPVFLNFRESWVWQGRGRAYIGTEYFQRYDPPGLQQVAIATDQPENINIVVDLLKTYQPEITIIHALGGDKLDHGNSAWLMYLAFRNAIQRGIPVGKLWIRPSGWMTEPEAVAAGRARPDIRIDVTDFVKTQLEALNKHVSQDSGTVGKEGGIPWLRKAGEDGRIYEEFLTVMDNTTGIERKVLGRPKPPRSPRP